MEKLLLQYKASVISYMRFGSGARPVFCFHGYGEDAMSFAFLESYAGTQFSFFAIDLPFHGLTIWKEGYNCTTDDLIKVVEQILGEHKLQNLDGSQKIALMGFSLGGRIALALYEKIPANVDRLILLAPDGLKVNFWYWLSTQTWIGNRLFLITMKYPTWFFGFLKLLNKLNLVNASIFKFVNYYIGDREVRKLLYARWTTLRKISPHLQRIKSSVRLNNTQVQLIYGTHDRIILSSVGEKFRKGIEGHCTITVINAGHQVLHEKHVKDILAALTVIN